MSITLFSFEGFKISLKPGGKLYPVIHTPRASFNDSMSSYEGTLSSLAIRLPSSIAAAVAAFGVSSFKLKGIPFSLISHLQLPLVGWG